MPQRLSSYALCLLLAACASGPQVRAQERTPPPPPPPGGTAVFHPERNIHVSGVGEAKAPPDEAHLDFAVETEGKTAQQAGQENQRRMDAVLAALVKAGVPRKELETQQYSLLPELSYPPPQPHGGEQKPRIVGYRATNSVSLRTRQLDKLGAFIDTALAAGANRVDSVRFALANPQEAQGRALQDAVQRARKAAEVMAASLDVKLGEVLEASTVTEPHPPQPIPFVRAARAEMGDASQTPITPAEQTVQVRVELRFAIGGGR